MSGKIKCLFGFHNYTIPYKRWHYILICDQCLRFGYRAAGVIEYAEAAWYKFDEHGNKIYFKMYWTCGTLFEQWYDVEGNIINEKFS